MKSRGLLVALGMVLALALIGPGYPANAQGGGWTVETVEALPFDSVALRDVVPAPDGRQYIYLGEREGQTVLCVRDIPADRETCTPIPGEFPRWLSTGHPTLRALAWSPDSTRVALVGAPFGLNTDSDLWVWDIAAGSLTNLADDGFSGQFDQAPAGLTVFAQPAWSPDGSQIAVARSTTGDPGLVALAQLAVLDSTTGDTLFETTFPMAFTIGPDDLAFAPDGHTLAVSLGYGRGEPGNGLWLVDVTTRERRLLADGGLFDQWLNQIGVNDYSTQIGPLRWSPDGSRLVAWAGSGGFAQAPQAGFLVDPSSGVLENLLPPMEVLLSSAYIVFEPFQAAWSPDGSALIVAADGAAPWSSIRRFDLDAEAGRVTIYVIDATTGIGQIVVELPATNAGNGPVEDYARHDKAAWGPDGHVIIAGYYLHLVPAGG